jgi:hypothetical protein
MCEKPAASRAIGVTVMSQFTITALDPIQNEGDSGRTTYRFQIDRIGAWDPNVAYEAIRIQIMPSGLDLWDDARWNPGAGQQVNAPGVIRVSFSPGETSEIVEVTINADQMVETDEILRVELRDAIRYCDQGGALVPEGIANAFPGGRGAMSVIRNDDAAGTHTLTNQEQAILDRAINAVLEDPSLSDAEKERGVKELNDAFKGASRQAAALDLRAHGVFEENLAGAMSDGVITPAEEAALRAITLAPADAALRDQDLDNAKQSLGQEPPPEEEVQSEDAVFLGDQFGYGTNALIYGTPATGLAMFAGDENPAAQILIGALANDTLVGGVVADLLFGGSGRDLLIGGAGGDYLDGEDHDDGLHGGEGDDGLVGRGGHDAAFGGAGNDVMLLGTGDDSAEGGTGDDFAMGEDGNDLLVGGSGADALVGGLGNDTLYGEAGDDILIGNDFAASGSGFDSVAGGDGNDLLMVGAYGAAILDGGDGDDALYGGVNADVMIGGAGSDFMYGGGSGADLFVFALGDMTAGDLDAVFDLRPGSDVQLIGVSASQTGIIDYGGSAYLFVNLAGGGYWMAAFTYVTSADVQAALTFS